MKINDVVKMMYDSAAVNQGRLPKFIELPMMDWIDVRQQAEDFYGDVQSDERLGRVNFMIKEVPICVKP